MTMGEPLSIIMRYFQDRKSAKRSLIAADERRGLNPTVTPAQSPGRPRGAAAVSREGAERAQHKGEHERPHPPEQGALDQVVDGTRTQDPEHCSSLARQNSAPNKPQDERMSALLNIESWISDHRRSRR